jgi:predicted Zn-dependent peptidase
VYVGAGSRHEDLETTGTAYLLEKMFFRGTTSKSKTEIAESIDSLGAIQKNTTGREISNFTL